MIPFERQNVNQGNNDDLFYQIKNSTDELRDTVTELKSELKSIRTQVEFYV